MEKEVIQDKEINITCPFKLKASRDALEIISGKWRIPIIICLTYHNKKFGELQKEIGDISPKMLSQELQELEVNKLVYRKVNEGRPVTIEYGLTPLALTIFPLLDELLEWGVNFRKAILTN